VIAEGSEIQRKTIAARGEGQSSKLTVLLCRIACVGFALFETWSQRFFINEDGASYLDMSDALIKHDWHLLVNPIWSPLYPFLIGAATWFARPQAQLELEIVHALNFVIFLGALASFEFFLRQVIRVFRTENERADANSAVFLPVWIWQLLGYSLFAWTTLGMMVAPRMVTPDLCVAAFVYLDCGLLLSLRAGIKRSRISILLGLTLGLGYLAKAILFPMAFVFMIVAFFFIGDWKKATRSLALTFLVFCAIAAPFFVAMSTRVGKLSYSEVGNLNYAWHVNHVGAGKAAGGPFYFSDAGPPAYLRHPLTLLYRHPDAFDVREPTAFTYAPRQDMEYWAAGTKAGFNPGNQLRAIAGGLKVLFADPHAAPVSGLIVVGVILLVTGQKGRRNFKSILRGWPLLIPGILAPCLYLLVSVEPRYVAPFFVIVLMGLFPGLLLQRPADAANRIAASTVVVSISLMALSALFVGYHLAGFPRGESNGLLLHVGQSLNAAGVRPGEEVAIVGDSADGCRWARMAHVRIVAQILREDVDDFWRLSDPRMKTEVYDAFARAGAKAVVAEQAPPSGDLSDWQRLGDTDYYVHILTPSRSN
jgi:hypothetical protein